MQTETFRLTLICLFSLLVTAATPWLGLSAFEDAAMREVVLMEVRLPRMLFAFTAGCGLAVCGMVFQAMFQNPLATPFTLGVASGASLGAATSVYLGLGFSLMGIDATTLSAFLGAMLAITLVYGISHFRYGFSGETLLLTGVAVSFFFSSLILLIQYLSNVSDAFQIVRWLMGGLTISSYDALLQLLPFVTLCIAVVLWLGRELNLLMAGDDIALSRGVSVMWVRYLLFFTTSLCIGAIVAFCGPIGFVGMMIPHICRLLVGNDHRLLTPASIMLGGGFLVLCDMLARLLIAPTEIPVGVITALLGGPFFLWLLIHMRKRPA